MKPLLSPRPTLIVPLAVWALSLAPAAAQARPAGNVDSCSWDKPGHNPFTGDPGAAIERYTDIPVAARARLKRRLRERRFDEVVTIGRDSISGESEYDPRIRDMNFGNGRVCRRVTRSGWTPARRERALVYCEAGDCILVPDICRNVSRVTRMPAGAGGAARAAAAGFGSPGMPSLPGAVPAPAYLLPGWMPAGADASSRSLGWISPSPEPGWGPPPLSPVPEPATWLMMLAGVSMLALRRS